MILRPSDIIAAPVGTRFTDREGDEWIVTRRGLEVDIGGRRLHYLRLDIDELDDEFGPFTLTPATAGREAA